MQHTAAFSSQSVEWATPQEFYDAWDRQFGFNLDAAATAENAKCQRFYTVEDDGLSQPWEGIVFCNPPYGREIGKWVRKGYESAQDGATVVMLIPAKTETRWWHDYVAKAHEIHLVKGRLKFGGHHSNAPFPSCVVVFTMGDGKPQFFHGGRP